MLKVLCVFIVRIGYIKSDSFQCGSHLSCQSCTKNIFRNEWDIVLRQNIRKRTRPNLVFLCQIAIIVCHWLSNIFAVAQRTSGILKQNITIRTIHCDTSLLLLFGFVLIKIVFQYPFNCSGHLLSLIICILLQPFKNLPVNEIVNMATVLFLSCQNTPPQ